MQKISSYLFILLAAIVWGTTGTAQTFAPEGAGPLAIGAVRLILGGIILLFIALVKGEKIELAKWDKRMLILAAISISAYQPLFFAGVNRAGVAVGTVVAIGSAPIVTGTVEYFTGDNKPGVKWIAASASSIIGCILLLAMGKHIKIDVAGIVFSLCAGISYALYTLASKKLLDEHSPRQVTAMIFSFSGILLFPLLLTQNLQWILSVRGGAVAIHLGFFTAALAFSMFNRGLTKVSASKASVLVMAEPLTAAILAIAVLQEELTVFSCIGLILILSGLIILTVPIKRMA